MTLTTKDGRNLRVWAYGLEHWEYDERWNCYITKEQPAPAYFCLGERMVHWDVGRSLRGSESDNWHGWDFGLDLKSAIEWVQEAKYPELAAGLWTKRETIHVKGVGTADPPKICLSVTFQLSVESGNLLATAASYLNGTRKGFHLDMSSWVATLHILGEAANNEAVQQALLSIADGVRRRKRDDVSTALVLELESLAHMGIDWVELAKSDGTTIRFEEAAS